MESIPGKAVPQPSASSFILLPPELRDMIYSLLIREAIVETSPPLGGLPTWQTPTFSRPHHFDLQISTKRVTHPNLRLPSNLIYACHQINAEMNTLICSRIHHLKLTGDFMMGLSSTRAIFDILDRRPWIARATRTVNVMLKLDHVLPLSCGVAVNSRVLEQHPWLDERLKIAELKVKKFDMNGFGMVGKPQRFWQVMKVREWCLSWWLECLGMESKREEKMDDLGVVEAGHEHNTLPDLARLFETFPLLEKIDIETEHRHLLSLFPASRAAADSFQKLDKRGVEVNVLVKYWQMQSFCNMLYRNGIERGTIQFGSGHESSKVALSYQTLPELGHRVVRFRLVDCMLQPDDMVDDTKTNSELSRWKRFCRMWLWRKEK